MSSPILSVSPAQMQPGTIVEIALQLNGHARKRKFRWVCIHENRRHQLVPSPETIVSLQLRRAGLHCFAAEEPNGKKRGPVLSRGYCLVESPLHLAITALLNQASAPTIDDLRELCRTSKIADRDINRRLDYCLSDLLRIAPDAPRRNQLFSLLTVLGTPQVHHQVTKLRFRDNPSFSRDDIVQDACKRACEHLDRFIHYKKRCRFGPWFAQIGRNLVIDFYRRQATEREGLQELQRETYVVPDDPSHDIADCVDWVYREATEFERELFDKRITQDQTWEQIAKDSGLKLSMVRRKCHAGWERLRKLFETRLNRPGGGG